MGGYEDQPDLLIEAWRVQAEAVWREAVVYGTQPTMVDWLGPWIDLAYLRGHMNEWRSFWREDVDVQHLPREWIRGGMNWVQRFQKVTDGAPVDEQLASYLTDNEVFVTSDRRLAHALEMLRPDAPVALAATHVAPGGKGAAERAVEILTTWPVDATSPP